MIIRGTYPRATTQELETKMEYEQEDNKIEKGTRDVHNCQANDYTSLY